MCFFYRNWIFFIPDMHTIELHDLDFSRCFMNACLTTLMLFQIDITLGSTRTVSFKKNWIRFFCSLLVHLWHFFSKNNNNPNYSVWAKQFLVLQLFIIFIDLSGGTCYQVNVAHWLSWQVGSVILLVASKEAKGGAQLIGLSEQATTKSHSITRVLVSFSWLIWTGYQVCPDDRWRSPEEEHTPFFHGPICAPCLVSPMKQSNHYIDLLSALATATTSYFYARSPSPLPNP